MTTATRDDLEIEKLRAEIAKLIADTIAANQRAPLEALKLDAETIRLKAEAAKIQRELRWYPWISLIIASLALIGAIAGLLLKH